MAKLYLLDIINNEAKEVLCTKLDDYYKHLQCDCFDIAYRKLGDTYFDIFVDDEGLLKDDPMVSALNNNHEPMLVGNLIFSHHDSAGNTTSVSEEDIKLINSHIIDNIATIRDGKEIRVGKMLVGLEY